MSAYANLSYTDCAALTVFHLAHAVTNTPTGRYTGSRSCGGRSTYRSTSFTSMGRLEYTVVRVANFPYRELSMSFAICRSPELPSIVAWFFTPTQ